MAKIHHRAPEYKDVTLWALNPNTSVVIIDEDEYYVEDGKITIKENLVPLAEPHGFTVHQPDYAKMKTIETLSSLNMDDVKAWLANEEEKRNVMKQAMQKPPKPTKMI